MCHVAQCALIVHLYMLRVDNKPSSSNLKNTLRVFILLYHLIQQYYIELKTFCIATLSCVWTGIMYQRYKVKVVIVHAMKS
jgi:hypothetical protein